MITTVSIIVIVLVALAIGLRYAHKLYPLDPVRNGQQVHIYQDGRYDRTATITGLFRDRIVIYDILPLPIHYRGKFYSVGYDSNGVKLLFLGRKKLFFLARMAELIRKVVNKPDYIDDSLSKDLRDLLDEEMEDTSDEV